MAAGLSLRHRFPAAKIGPAVVLVCEPSSRRIHPMTLRSQEAEQREPARDRPAGQRAARPTPWRPGPARAGRLLWHLEGDRPGDRGVAGTGTQREHWWWWFTSVHGGHAWGARAFPQRLAA